MYCIYCGQQIEADSKFCKYCGQKVPKDLTQSPQPTIFYEPVAKKDWKKIRKRILAITAAVLSITVLVVATIGFITVIGGLLTQEQAPEKDNEVTTLQNILMQDWTRTGTMEHNYSTYKVTYTLDFTEDALSCSYVLTDSTITLTAFNYEILSENEFQRENAGTRYTVTFNDDKTVMTISPGISSKDTSEIWVSSGKSSQQTQQGTNASSAEKEALQQNLSKNWTRTDGADGYYYDYELYFSYGVVSYKYTYFQDEYWGYNFNYEIISGNQIKDIGSGKVYTITFNDAKNVMTISPAISTSADSEKWFYMGD